MNTRRGFVAGLVAGIASFFGARAQATTKTFDTRDELDQWVGKPPASPFPKTLGVEYECHTYFDLIVYRPKLVFWTDENGVRCEVAIAAGNQYYKQPASLRWHAEQVYAAHVLANLGYSVDEYKDHCAELKPDCVSVNRVITWYPTKPAT